MKVFWPGLLSGKYVPARNTSLEMPGGMNISPHIAWGEVPPATRSFILTIIDNAAGDEPFVHWLVINIPLHVREVLEKSSGIRDRMPDGSMELRNSTGEMGYAGPFLPRGTGMREYRVTVYALSRDVLEFGPLSKLGDVLSEIGGLLLDAGTTTAFLHE